MIASKLRSSLESPHRPHLSTSALTSVLTAELTDLHGAETRSDCISDFLCKCGGGGGGCAAWHTLAEVGCAGEKGAQEQEDRRKRATETETVESMNIQTSSEEAKYGRSLQLELDCILLVANLRVV